MKKLIDISFDMHRGRSNPEEVIEKYKEGLGYVHFLKKHFEITVIDHINYNGALLKDGVNYRFFKCRQSFWAIPLETLLYIRKEKPDIVIVQGNTFPLQVLLLKFFLHSTSLIIVQNHSNLPYNHIKKILQRTADRFINAYFFTALGNTKIWIDNKIISSQDKCYEVLEGSVYLQKQDKQQSKVRLHINGNDVFLWVGRLHRQKGPLTVIDGFEKYLNNNPAAKLYMIYQVEDLLPAVKAKINNSLLLKNAVTLVGKIEHDELEHWFSAADFYLSGSYGEVAGFALLEAMACGCIPVVTDIPPFRKITGRYGFLFETGNSDSLLAALIQTSKVQKNELSEAIVNYFNDKLSFKTIAEDIFRIYNELTVK